MNSVCTRAVGRCTVGGTHAPSGVMGGAYRRCRWDARDARGVWAVAVPKLQNMCEPVPMTLKE